MSAVLQPVSLEQWLHWQEGLHPRTIDLDLGRVGAIADRMNLRPLPARVITVAGTNGKGSCALILEALLGAPLGARVGTYTSPHLIRYNERIRIDGVAIEDSALVRAFEAVEAVRGDIGLTYFEFGTLAALWSFVRAGVDTAILEVGMGGRLDAVNILDADVALVTNIGLDHCDWLGHDRETIGREKAGILRPGRPAVCADPAPPDSLLATAADQRIPLLRLGVDYELTASASQWLWRDWRGNGFALAPQAQILADNLAAALAVVTALDETLTPDAVTAALDDFAVPGRRQILPGAVQTVLDVGHNTEAMALLAGWLAARPVAGRTLVVVGMLANKPVARATAALAAVADRWYAADLAHTPRGLSGAALAALLPGPARVCADVAAACAAAWSDSRPGDRVLICGSFHTVGAAMVEIERWTS